MTKSADDLQVEIIDRARRLVKHWNRTPSELAALLLQAAGEDEDYLPDFDMAEFLGFDGTLRGLDGRPAGEPVGWQELALAALKRLGYDFSAYPEDFRP